jgi:hypothetical protein
LALLLTGCAIAPHTILSPPATSTSTSTTSSIELLETRTQFLFNEPASNVINFLFEIQDYIKTDNREELANLILYPITINSIDGKDVVIHNEKEFIDNYDKIATNKWKKIILSQEPTQLFTNSKGIMVNRGELWFGPVCLDSPNCQQIRYYIYSITNDTPW